MLKARNIRSGVLLAAFLAGFGWLVLRPHEPAYQGRPLSAWLEEACRDGTDEISELRSSPRAVAALHALAPDALPVLIRMVGTRMTIGRQIVGEMASAEEFAFLHLPRQREKHAMALLAFRLLGAEARPAVPGLAKLLRDRDDDVRTDAAEALAAIGPEAVEAVPALIALWDRTSLTNWPGFEERKAVAHALGAIGRGARSALPHLGGHTNDPAAELAAIRIRGDSCQPFIERLNDSSDSTKWAQRAELVGQLGKDAEPALPLLLAALEPASSIAPKHQAIEAIARIHRRPDLCLPHLIPLLRSTNYDLCWESFRALRAFGPAAKAAVPELLCCLTNSGYWQPAEVTNLLLLIDPEAAARAGVKNP